MKTLTAILLLSFSFHSFAIDKVVYGSDDRKDIFESTNAMYKQLATSTAAMISSSALETQADGSIKITGGNLEQEGVCSDERFAKQTVAANCSGFLVGDQYLVTAGHCIQSMSDCESYTWVFGFANDVSEKTEYSVGAKDVYKCTQIISRTLDHTTLNDYAFVKLDRKVEGRTPLKFRTKGKIADNADILVIGHPTGLPTKIADGATVRSNKNKYYFQGTLDTFGGNSGSAVFDAKTGLVEGILVRGETDYVSDSVQNCTRPKVCKVTECRGEDSTRITNIAELMKMAVKK
jgi:V8-like Glu-specific endopeptidase